jgi:predicted transport protein
MSDIKIFRINDNGAAELKGTSVALEKSLQTLIETHLETFLGVRFLASEYSTGAKHGGRIDTLGIDENHCAVIIEYKRTLNENVINQGLYYLDWLLDHKAEFNLLVMSKLGQVASNQIEWSSPRLLCIAGDFNKYDEHAVQQINRNIELIRYRRFSDDLLLFELVNATTAQSTSNPVTATSKSSKQQSKTVTEQLSQAKSGVSDLFESLKAFLMALGDDVQMKTLKHYIAFKRLKNFACVEVYQKSGKLLVYLKVDPDTIELKEGFTRNVRNIGHYSPGDLEVTINSAEKMEAAKSLMIQSYEAS